MIAESERRQLTPEHCFKSRAEMAALFADLPEALASTVEIAQRCAFRPKTRKPILPRFTGSAARRWTRPRSCAAQAEEGLTAAHRHARPRAGPHASTTTASGSTSSSASSSA